MALGDLRCAEFTEVAIRLQIVMQVTTDQLDHDGLIEQRRRCPDAGSLKHASAFTSRCESSALSRHSASSIISSMVPRRE